MTRLFVALGMLLSLLHPTLGLGNPEAPGMYDARNMGMGGAGLAHLTSPAAVLHNPANLVQNPTSQNQSAFTLLGVKLGGSFAGPDHYQESDWIAVPLPFWGYINKHSNDLAYGASFYLSLGFGGGYDGVKRYGTGKKCTTKPSDVIIDDGNGGVMLDPTAIDNDQCLSYSREEMVNMALFELAFPVSYRVNDRLRVGISFRFPFGMFEQQTTEDFAGAFTDPDTPVGSYGLGFTQVQSKMYGVGDPGILLGVSYDVTEYFTVAAAYRTKTTTTMKGKTDVVLESNMLLDPALDMLGGLPVGGYADLVNSIPGVSQLVSILSSDNIYNVADKIATDIDSQISWSTAEAIELGIALQVTPTILFAMDWRRAYFSDSNKDFIVELKEPIFEASGLDRLGQKLDWEDADVWSLGVEWNFKRNQYLRFGYSMGNSATPEAYTNAFTPPPADQQDSFYIGYGTKKGRWLLDIGFNYATVEYEIDQPYDSEGNPVDTPTCRAGQLVKSGCPGLQTVESVFLGLSANYQY
ncbi:MAG: hypothetical protein CMK89_11540 [Pseudomonadales bacterium]|nr:hypothetical protein [Pseudomonadales bacterium]